MKSTVHDIENVLAFPGTSVHNFGHVCLEDAMGSDLHIVNNARVSFDQESTDFGKHERGLLNFLMREHHGSPWESVVFRFDIKAPLFVIREWQRHRIGSFNEQSSRYSEIPDQYYVPEDSHVREQTGKPGNYQFTQIADPLMRNVVIDTLEETQRYAFSTYRHLLDMGVAKEVARIVLPVGMYSRMKWTVNLRSLFNFVQLRNHEHAQREIRDYAEVVERMAKRVCPIAMEVFAENGRVCP